MPTLAELQIAFRRALLEDDAAGLAAFVRPDGLAVAERLAVYRDNVRSSLAGLLEDAFPAVRRLVGEPFFAHAAQAFIALEPPAQPCLLEYGGGFPQFLAAFPPCREHVYLADVARLEWLMHRAAHAPDAAALAPEALEGVAAADTPRLVLGLHPSLGLIASRFPIDRIWRANRSASGESAAVDLAAGGARLAVRRSGGDVVMRALPAAALAFRAALQAGQELAAATDAALAEDAGFDLAAALAGLFREGLVVAIGRGAPPPR